MTNKSLDEVKSKYKKYLDLYNRQEEWMDSHPAKVTKEIMEKFNNTIAALGELGNIIEEQYNYKMTIEEKLGKVGPFVKKTIEQLDLL